MGNSERRVLRALILFAYDVVWGLLANSLRVMRICLYAIPVVAASYFAVGEYETMRVSLLAVGYCLLIVGVLNEYI